MNSEFVAGALCLFVGSAGNGKFVVLFSFGFSRLLVKNDDKLNRFSSSVPNREL